MWTVIALGLVATAVYWLSTSLGGGRERSADETGPSARQILDRRLAAGEIGVEEHARLRAAIEGRSGPPEPPPSGRPAAAGG